MANHIKSVDKQRISGKAVNKLNNDQLWAIGLVTTSLLGLNPVLKSKL